MNREIVFLINSLRGGGAERVCVTIANALHKRGCTVSIWVKKLSGEVFLKDLDPGIKIEDMNEDRAIFCLPAIKKLMDKSGPTVIMGFSYELIIQAAFLAGMAGKKFKIIFRVSNMMSSRRQNQKGILKRYLGPWLAGFLFKNISHFICQSKEMATDLLKEYDIVATRVSVIHNPVSPKIYASELTREPNRVPVDGGNLLYLGRLTRQKDPELLLSALEILRKSRPRIRLVMAGDGPLMNDLMEICKKKNLSDCVEFKGFCNNVNELFDRADVTCLVSQYEGFPNVLVESLAHGVPIVSVNCPSGPSEIVVEGINGYLVNERSPEAFAKALGHTLEKVWSGTEVKMTGEKFSVEMIAEEYASHLCK